MLWVEYCFIMEAPLVYLITNPIWLGWVDAVTVCFTFHAHTQSSLLWWSLPGPLELIQLIKTNKGIWLGLLHILAWLYLLALPWCVVARFQGATSWKSEVIRKYANHLLTEENGEKQPSQFIPPNSVIALVKILGRQTLQIISRISVLPAEFRHI